MQIVLYVTAEVIKSKLIIVILKERFSCTCFSTNFFNALKSPSGSDAMLISRLVVTTQ